MKGYFFRSEWIFPSVILQISLCSLRFVITDQSGFQDENERQDKFL